MREIKFRAWHEYNKKMVYGPTDDDHSPSWVLVMCSANNIEPMQFTGLKDCNGKDIYEGDILLGGLVIQYGETSCGCCSYVHGYDLDKNDPYYGLPEVIGNVWENKELLDDSSV